MSKPRGMRVTPLLLAVLVAGIIIGLVGGVAAVRITLQPNWYVVATDFQILIAAIILFLGLGLHASLRLQRMRESTSRADGRQAEQRLQRERQEIARAAAMLARLTLIAGDLVRFDPIAIHNWMLAEADRKREKKRGLRAIRGKLAPAPGGCNRKGATG